MTKDRFYRYVHWDYGIDLYEVENKLSQFWETRGRLWVAYFVGGLLLLPAMGSLFVLVWIYPCIMWFYFAIILSGLLLLLWQNEKA